MAIRSNKFNLVLDIPEGKINDYAIKHIMIPAKKPIKLNTLRTALFGQTGGEVVYPTKTRWHQLSYSGGVWMTDLPIEQKQINALVRGLHGSVLIGGLGLGYAATKLCSSHHVSSVTVVEIAKEVIDLVEPHLLGRAPKSRKKLKVVQADLFKYLDETTDRFDCAFYDIWQSDGECTFFSSVVPLLQKSPRVCVNRPACWNEDIMRSQLYMSLVSAINLYKSGIKSNRHGLDWWEPDGTTEPYHNWMVDFFKVYHRNRESLIKDDYMTSLMATRYAKYYGCHDWQKTWSNFSQFSSLLTTAPTAS